MIIRECKHPTCGDTCRREKKPGVKWHLSKGSSLEAPATLLPLNDLINYVQAEFNSYIRLRDQDRGCISCEKGRVEHAGHFHPQGKFSGVRLDEMNVNGQCRFCNCEMQGNLEEYHTGLVLRYSAEEAKELFFRASMTKMKKWSRDELISILNDVQEKTAALTVKKKRENE